MASRTSKSRIRATPDTPYPVADISETVAAVLVLQCAEQRRLVIDEAIDRLGGSLSEENATVRQVLNHTSAGTPANRSVSTPSATRS